MKTRFLFCSTTCYPFVSFAANRRKKYGISKDGKINFDENIRTRIDFKRNCSLAINVLKKQTNLKFYRKLLNYYFCR